MLKIKNVTFVYEKDKPLNVKVGEVTIPTYTLVGAFVVVGIAILVQSYFS